MLKRYPAEEFDVASVSLFEKLWGRQGNGRDLVIGRGLDCDIVLDSAQCPLLISRTQAVLSRRGAQLLLADTGSTNGSFVNGRKLADGERCPLSQGDLVSFGGPKKVKPAGQTEDEPNPFLFQLVDLQQLFSAAPPPPPLPVGVATQALSQAEGEVVDLTNGNSPPNSFAGPSRPPSSRKRVRQRQQQHVIDLDAWTSDEDVEEKPAAKGVQAAITAPAAAPAATKTGPSASSPGSILLKALESQFECQICREFMVATHSLVPCGHMFCGECVGEWLCKQRSCPSCRASITAAPVPSLKVDNMLDEVVVPSLDAEAKQERTRRQQTWATVGEALTGKLQKEFSRAPAHRNPFLQQLPFAGQLAGIPGFPEILIGNFGAGSIGGLPAPPPPQGARRMRRLVNFAPAPQHQAPPPPPPAQQSPFSFGLAPRCAGDCPACNGPLHIHQPVICQNSGRAGSHMYHTYCDTRVPGFLNAWRAALNSGRGFPGAQMLPAAEMERLRRIQEPYSRYARSTGQAW